MPSITASTLLTTTSGVVQSGSSDWQPTSFSAMNGPATGIRSDFAQGSSLKAKEAPTPRPYQPTSSAPPVMASRPDVPGSGVIGSSAGLGGSSTATTGSSAWAMDG